MSIAAAAALFTTGAMAFDYTYDGEIVADITNATLDTTKGVTGRYASYMNKDGNASEAGDENLTLSTNAKGDALIYPAFKAGEGWSSNLVVRNAENNATVCKVVLYAADNSRELLDFNIYLSPYDVFRFNIAEDGTVSTSDGSFTLVDPTLATDSHKFVEHNGAAQVIGKINARAENADVISGYAVIYGMVEATNAAPGVRFAANGTDLTTTGANASVPAAYHGDHSKLFEDFRALSEICRDDDSNLSTPASWRAVLGSSSASIQNGTAVDINVTAPNVLNNCLDLAMAANNDNNETNKTIAGMVSNFDSPSSDLLFGDVTISKAGDDSRNLLIPATALDNYTAANQMMLWADGEYAAIQDRRLGVDTQANAAATNGFATQTRPGYCDYNLTGIVADSAAFNTALAYYTFDKNEMKGANTLLLTQPTKRAMIMANQASMHWVSGTTGMSPIANKWGEFTTASSYYDENELLDVAATALAVVISPVSGDPDAAYKNELQAINDPERTETSSSVFAVSGDNGFAIMKLGTVNNGLPAIATQMTGSVVGGESQINWVYSTTNK